MTYDYCCTSCNATFEAEQKITDEPLKTCARDGCGGSVRRLISGTSFVLKGNGWGRDLYGSSDRGGGGE